MSKDAVPGRRNKSQVSSKGINRKIPGTGNNEIVTIQVSNEPDRLQSDLCAQKLKALSDPLRLRIIDTLRKGEMTVGTLTGKLESNIVLTSHHLGILFQAGLVEREKKGRYVNYRLSESLIAREAGQDHLDLGCCRLEIPKENSDL